MEKVYTYYIMMKLKIEKSFSEIYNEHILPVPITSTNIWNDKDSKSGKEYLFNKENLDSIHSYSSWMMTSVIINFRDKREVHINTNYSITGWMLCVIPHICKDVTDNSHRNNRNQARCLYKTMFVTYQKTKMDMIPYTFKR